MNCRNKGCSLPVSTEVPQSTVCGCAIDARSSASEFFAFSDRQLRRGLYSAICIAEKKHEQKTVFCSRRLKKRNRIPVSSIVSAGNVIEGNLSCLMCLFGRNRRPSPQCLRLLPLLGKRHQTRSWLNRSLLVANQQCRLCSPGIGPTSTAGYFGSSAMRRLPRTS